MAELIQFPTPGERARTASSMGAGRGDPTEALLDVVGADLRAQYLAPPPPDVASRHIEAMVHAARQPVLVDAAAGDTAVAATGHGPAGTTTRRWRARLLVPAAIVGATVLGTVGAAAAGVLPDGLQARVASVGRTFGLQWPDPTVVVPTSPPAPGGSTSGPPPSTAPAAGEPGAQPAAPNPGESGDLAPTSGDADRPGAEPAGGVGADPSPAPAGDDQDGGKGKGKDKGKDGGGEGKGKDGGGEDDPGGKKPEQPPTPPSTTPPPPSTTPTPPTPPAPPTTTKGNGDGNGDGNGGDNGGDNGD